MRKRVDIDLVELSPLRPKRGGLKPSPRLLVSIMKYGIKTPVVVRTIPDTQPTHYELVKGEAVWIGAQEARLSQVLIVINNDISDAEVKDCIKGECRQSLTVRNHMEDAEDFEYLHQIKKISKTAIGIRFNLSRADVSQTIRLLDLDFSIQEKVRSKELPYTHARILAVKDLPADQQLKLATAAIKQNLRVKAFQALLNGDKQKSRSVLKTAQVQNAVPAEKDRETIKLEQALSDLIGCRVEIDYQTGRGGDLKIHYDNLDILDGVLERLGYQP